MPGIRPSDVEEYCISQHVSGCHDDALLIQQGVEQVFCDQVRFQRELFLGLPISLDLPDELECIGGRGELSLTVYWLRRCRARANWVCRVRIVINKLTEVCEDVDFYQRFRWWWRRYVFPVLAI